MHAFRLRSTLCVAVAAGLLLAGCARMGGDPLVTGSVPEAASAFANTGASQDQLTRQAQRWGRAYENDPDDPEIAIAYAESLDAIGRTELATEILTATVARKPDSGPLMAAFGRLMVRNGDAQRAIGMFEKAGERGTADWRTLSAHGAALDQIGRHADAQALYQRALRQRPDSPAILSNYGLSQALSGDIAAAETTLRRASEKPGADVRVRQNLVLVLGLQGKFNAAEKLAREDMGADEARRNMAYLRDMLSQDDRWSQIRQSG